MAVASSDFVHDFVTEQILVIMIYSGYQNKWNVEIYKLENQNVQLKKMNVIPLAILGVKWPFSKGRGRQ